MSVMTSGTKKLEGQYVIAIFPYKKRLVVKWNNKINISFYFPIEGHIVVPLFSTPKGKISFNDDGGSKR